ncbi:alpha/beta hydrolase [Sphaerisporangium melleum]|uniref:Alpha/beta hydrolase n=1 Tax=Sphaerisporangium melleum TaxID=321316 RepID=A0A917RDT3_9ACTN|nr:alpha/beta hydrolase [Sphaerisporangium melleum]GGL02489.1 alpha/beta hydrolase [Sphaerisporangium melleum]GII72253.1 alpha/beta hydrolase [Sphaerisporangium melleum]
MSHTGYYGGLAADDHGSAGDRPALVLLHGLTYDRRQWGPLLGELARLDPGRRVLAVDLPGHGGSPRWDHYDLDEVVAAVHAAVTEAGLAAPIVVGHSLGGVLVTKYAAAHPARGVVNIDQPLLVGRFGDILRQAEPVLRGPAWSQIWDRMLATMQVDRLPPAARDLVATATGPRQDLLLGYWNEILVDSAEELGRRRARDLEVIRSSGVPYRYVSAHQPDPAYLEWLTSALRDLTVTVLPGGGHFPHVVHPREMAGLLTG